MPFKGLGLSDAVVRSLEEKGFTAPTPIQEQAIPMILEGKDVIGSAQTGTGKTAAFGLPILQLMESHGKCRCLILEPTRELADQVGNAIEEFAKNTDLETTIIYGGVGYGKQKDDLSRGVDIIVATPGRLLDHLQQRTASLKDVEYLVLDEVDRMLDMGFLPDVRRIIKYCKEERQTLLFTATIPPQIESLTKWVMKDPHVVSVNRDRSTAETISHAFYPIVETQKFKLLLSLLEDTHYESVLIFTRTKFNADMICGRLERLNHPVAALHSDRSQKERTEALEGFKSGKYEVLVATDIAARGLDIAGISHVINFDVPQNPEDYVHRIGRTGRAQREGDAFTLLTEDETKYAAMIERFIGKKVDRKIIEGFDYMYSALFDFENGGGEKTAAPKSRLRRGAPKRLRR